MLVEVSVDSHRHVVADTHHCTKGIGTETEVSILTHVLEALSLLLRRIVAAAETVDLDALALDFNAPASALAFYQRTYGADTSTSSNLTELILIDL